MPSWTVRHLVTPLALAAAALAPGPCCVARAQDLADLERQMVQAAESGRVHQAERLARQGIDAARGRGEWSNVVVFSVKLGTYHSQRGANRVAEPVLREAADLSERGFRPDESWTVTALQLHGACLDGLGRFAEAGAVYRRALDRAGRLNPFRPEAVANLRRKVDGTLAHLGKVREAERAYRQSVALAEPLVGRDDELLINALCDLAALLQKLGRPDETAALYKRAVAVAEANPAMAASVLGAPPPLAPLLLNVGEFHRSAQQLDEADRLAQRALKLLLATVGPRAEATAAAHELFGRVAVGRGRFEVVEG